MGRKRSGGFTLIEVLVVVAIIGILATLAIVNYQSAILRSRQKRTMADMRAIAVAWEARATDMRKYNAAGFSMPAAPLTYTEVAGMLDPTYVRSMPRVDGWGHPYSFATDHAANAALPSEEYAIRSPGRDGQIDRTTYSSGVTEDPNADIVFSGGTFIQYPKGNQ